MKKLLIICVILVSYSWVTAQNVQLHYDMGKDREYLTTTVEMFKPDKFGSTFFFIDMDYGYPGIKGVSLGYFEIARGLKFWKSPFEIHLEYNGGFGQFQATPFNGAFQINDSWLFGGNYTWNNPTYSRIFTLQAMYKNIRGVDDKSFQITGVWTLKFFNNKVTCNGFADFWKEKKTFVNSDLTVDETKYVFLTEPQFWFNFTPNFSLGSEIEISSNFGGNKGFMVNPTAAGKWTF